MKKTKLICTIALFLLFAAIFFTGCTSTNFEEIFYCSSTNYWSIGYGSDSGTVGIGDNGHFYYTTPVQKATRSHAEYRAVKVAETKGQSAQYEIRDKQTNELAMIIEYNADGKVLNFSQKISPHRTSKYIYEYNKDGTLGKILFSPQDTDEMYTWVEFEYDSTGRCVHSVQYGYSASKGQRISNDMTYEYSNDGKTVKITEYNSINHANNDNPEEHSYIYEYDDDGKIVKRTCLNTEGKEEGYILCEYKDSLLHKENRFLYYSHLDEIHEFTYLPLKSAQEKWATSGWAACSISWPVVEHDESGRTKKMFLYHPDYLCNADPNAEPIVFFEFLFEYDAMDNISRESVVQDGKTVLSIQYEYDKDGLCYQSTAYDGNNQIIMENSGYIGIVGSLHAGNGYAYDFSLRLELYENEEGECTDAISYGVIDATLSPEK